MNLAAIITAAGSSQRMKGGVKKEYRYVDDMPILSRALLPFIQLSIFDSLILTIPPGQHDQVHMLLADFVDLSKIVLIDGGETRQESVYFGLLALEQFSPNYVLIHDGARPWVTEKTILNVLSGTEQQGACVPFVKASDAMKEVDKQHIIQRHLDRESTICVQTPQGFSFSQILVAHKKARQLPKQFIDDSEIYAYFVGPVLAVPGNIENRKITYEHDLLRYKN